MRDFRLNPYYRNPDHPNFNRRARHHDYTRAARYLITILKNPAVPRFSSITGTPQNISISLSASGQVIAPAISAWRRKYPVFIEKFAIMPDHLHLCLNVVASLPNGLGRAVGNLMGMISKAYWLSLPEEKRPVEISPLFTRGFNDRIAYSMEQWNNQIRYTVDNPRRYLMKKAYPDCLLRRWRITLPDNRSYILRGNIFLLRQPYLFRVKTSRSFTQAQAAEAMNEWKEALFNGGVPISPFIHPHEKALRKFATDNDFAYIRVCTNGFSEREAPGGKEFELMSGGRLLLIGKEEFHTQKEDLKYSYAQNLNQLALDIAQICNSGTGMTIRAI